VHGLNIAQLCRHVLHYAVVGGGGGGHHRHVWRHLTQDIDDATVIRTKIMPPVGDAMSFVHHQETNPAYHRQQDLFQKLIVGKAFR